MFSTHYIPYLLLNVLSTLVVWKYFDAIFPLSALSKRQQLLFYLFYYLERTFVYYSFDPVVNTANNLLFMVIVALQYRPLRASLVATFAHLVTIVLAEYLTASILLLITKSNFAYIATSASVYSVLGGVISQLIHIPLLMLMIPMLKRQRDGTIPRAYWLAILAVPIGSVYLLNFIYQISINVERLYADSLVSILVLMGINVLALLTYDRILVYFNMKLINQGLSQKMRAYAHQNQQIQQSQRIVREMKHNMNNLLTAVYLNLEQGNHAEATRKITELIGTLHTPDGVANSGYVLIDGMINHKASIAYSKGIDVKAHTQLAAISSAMVDDLCIIIGIALDNAIEACEAVPQKRVIDLSISALQGAVLMEMRNPIARALSMDSSDRILSTKPDATEHGWGLQSIRRLADKYHGAVQIQSDDRLFSLSLLLYDSVVDDGTR